jgi:anti-anti-sigma factor
MSVLAALRGLSTVLTARRAADRVTPSARAREEADGLAARIDDHDGVTVLTIDEKRLDAQIADQFRSELNALIESGKIRLCINLERVAFIDSSGLNVLIAGARSSQGRKGALKLACPQAAVKDLIEMTRLNRMIPVFATQEEALASFGT